LKRSECIDGRVQAGSDQPSRNRSF
jgi:hypothetical protein